MDDGRHIGPTEEVCWKASSRWGSMCSGLGIQDASSNVRKTLQEPGPWDGTVTHKRGEFTAWSHKIGGIR